MKTFVLVHGAWGGSWIWRAVADLLRGERHVVFTPSLTGVGERRHLATRETDLDTHIQDVLGTIEYEDLSGIVLVGFSYGGMVATGVAERVPECIAHLFYLDAFVPRDGQALLDLLAPAVRDGFLERARTAGDGWLIPPGPNPHLTPQPLKTFTQPLAVRDPVAARLPRTYVRCTGNPSSEAHGFAAAAERARAEG